MKSALKSHRSPSAARTAGWTAGVSPRPPLRLQIVSHSAAQTRRLGERLGRLLRGGEVLAVCGDLGAGKTCFIQGLARGLGVREVYLASPTFVFIQKYAGRMPFYHADLYRIERASDAEGLGLLECFDQKSVAAIEWADKAYPYLPPQRITLEIKNRGGKDRRLLFHIPAEFEHVIEKLK